MEMTELVRCNLSYRRDLNLIPISHVYAGHFSTNLERANFGVQRETLSRKVRWRENEKGRVDLWPLCPHVHTCLHIPPHINTHTHKEIVKIIEIQNSIENLRLDTHNTISEAIPQWASHLKGVLLYI